MKLYFLKPKDEISIDKKRLCPFEKYNYKKYFKNLLLKSSCHIHKKRIHMLHHLLFCYLSKCPHYNFMLKKYNQYKAKNAI